MNTLKLVALDSEDLAVISAHVQDAVLRIGDMHVDWKGKRFSLIMNRFAWEKKRRFLSRKGERRQSVLHFDRILGVRSTGIDRNDETDILNLLAIRFSDTTLPAGVVELVFSGGGLVHIDVECIEAQLADIGGAWETRSRPAHG